MTDSWDDIDTGDVVTFVNRGTGDSATVTVTMVDDDLEAIWVSTATFVFNSNGPFDVESVRKPTPVEPGVGVALSLSYKRYDSEILQATAIRMEDFWALVTDTSVYNNYTWEEIVKAAVPGTLKILVPKEDENE